MPMFRLRVALACAAMLVLASAADARTIRIVALGASNTYGSGQGQHDGGVSPGEAYPAQLEALLRARGIDARVSNAGVRGDTVAGMLARLGSAVPDGTDIVILQPGGNDARRPAGASRRDTIARLESQLRARPITVILLDRVLTIAPRATHDPDGQHLNVAGHAAVAAWLLPRVVAAIGRR